jgi:tetratricopeptide (TPR) repeat protein
MENDPANIDLLVGKARAQLFGEDYAGGLFAARTAVELDPESERAQAILAWALWSNGQSNAAANAAVQAITLNANYAPGHAFYSLVLNDQFNYDQAVREAELAVQLDPSLIEAYLALGYSNETQAAYQAAIDQYEQALRLNPNVIFLYRRIAFNYRTLGTRVANQSPRGTDDPQVLVYYSQAIAAFQRAIAIDRDYITPYLDLARTYTQIDQLADAERTLNDALEIAPRDPAVHGRIGLLRIARKNYEGALESLALAVNGGSFLMEYADGRDEMVTVEGLPLDVRSLEYYYSYGNMLAFQYECGPDGAMRYLQLARDFAPDNETVLGSYETSAARCAGRDVSDNDPNAEFAATPSP